MYTIGIYTPQRSRFEQITAIASPHMEGHENEFQFRHITKFNFDDELAGQILLVDIRAQKDFHYLKAASQRLTFPVLPILLYDHSPVILTPELMDFSACVNLNGDLASQIIQILNDHDQAHQLYIVKSKQFIRCFHPQDILYLEIDKHCVKLSACSGSIRFWGTLDQEEKKLRPMNFSRIHKSYIVNLRWIQKVTYYYVELKSNDRLPVGRKYRSDFQLQYETFLKYHS